MGFAYDATSNKSSLNTRTMTDFICVAMNLITDCSSNHQSFLAGWYNWDLFYKLRNKRNCQMCVIHERLRKQQRQLQLACQLSDNLLLRKLIVALNKQSALFYLHNSLEKCHPDKQLAF